MKKKLSVKQLVFAETYLATLDVVRAARECGYSGVLIATYGRRMLHSPLIKAHIKKRLRKKLNDLGITFEWKMQKLKDCVELAMPQNEETNKPVLIEYKALLGAISELNKMQGHHAAEKRVNTNLNADTDLETAKDYVKKYEQAY